MKVLVVGAGLTGVAVARTLAEAGIDIDLIDRRSHLAGNAYDFTNELGIRVHKYGPHLFHTNNTRVVEWLSQFTEWTDYQHRVTALLDDGTYVPFPPNQTTKQRVSEDQLVDVFYKPYTEKMWAMPWDEISESVVSRVKIKTNNCDLYFPNDSFQALPKLGYTHLVENAVDHLNIKVQLSTEYSHELLDHYDHCFYSGPIDEFWNERFGKLPYRSLEFTSVNLPITRLFPTSVVNFTHTGPSTRVTEWKNLPGHGSNPYNTTITYETPCEPATFDDCYYPVPDLKNQNRLLYKKYYNLNVEKVTFIGRCGTYTYINMDQAINQGLQVANKFLKRIENEET